MDECRRPCLARRLGHPPGALALQRIEIAGESADQVHRSIGARQDARQAFGPRHVTAGELDLAEIAESLQREGAFGMAAGDPETRAARQQFLRHMPPEKAAAAQQHHGLARERSATSLCHAS